MNGEILALDQFHHERGEIRCLLETVDRSDVRMVQRREHFGFRLKAGEAIDICGHRRREYLDRDLALQVRVGGAIRLAHAAHAEFGHDLIGTKARADHRGLFWAAASGAVTSNGP
jgi:hypothetical protein